MSPTSPNEITKEITEVHYMSIQPLDDISLGGCFHPNHHELLSLPSAPGPGIFLENPNIMEGIHHSDANPHREVYTRTHIIEMITLPFSPDGKEWACPLHKDLHPGSEPSQEGPEKATPSTSSEPKSEEKVETAKDGGDEKKASNGDADNLSPSNNPDDEIGLMYTIKMEYQWSPMLKYCTMSEMGYKPIQLL